MIDKNKLQSLENGKEEVNIDDPVILIRINRTYRESMSEEELYEYTRKRWVLSPKRARNAKYALSIYKGIVKEVYEIENWKFSSYTEEERKRRVKRYEFNGKIASNDIRAKYYNMSVAKCFKKGAANPIIYVNC